jgi:hypothetical protein
MSDTKNVSVNFGGLSTLLTVLFVAQAVGKDFMEVDLGAGSAVDRRGLLSCGSVVDFLDWPRGHSGWKQVSGQVAPEHRPFLDAFNRIADALEGIRHALVAKQAPLEELGNALREAREAAAAGESESSSPFRFWKPKT